MQVKIITDSAEVPVTLSEVKQWLKVDHTDDDVKLTELIASAVKTIENYINNPIITKTLLYTTDNYIVDKNGDIALYLPYLPTSVAFLKVYDIDDVDTTITAYNRYGSKIVFTNPPPSTVRLNAGYQVQFNAGVASNASTTPADIKIVIKEIVAYFYDDCCDKGLANILSTISGYINMSMLSYYE